MRDSFTRITHFTVSLFLAFALTLTGYSQKKLKSDFPKGTVKLKYSFPVNKFVKYLSVTKASQVMVINGQSIEVKIYTDMGCKLKYKGEKGENLKIEVQIDSMNMNIGTPQGMTNSSLKEAGLKTFNMVLSTLGKEIDVKEAEKIEYVVEGGRKRNMALTFQTFFPDLPVNPVKPGDIWIINDTINSNEPGEKIKQTIVSNNKFESIEKIDGISCAKITATLSGTRETFVQSQGMDVTMSGTVEGIDVLYFALKEGYFVKQTTSAKTTGNIVISGTQNMSFPMVMNMTSTNEVKK